jgi:hypothetical protein
MADASTAHYFPTDTADAGPGVRRQLVDAAGVRWDVWRCVPSATSKGLSDAFASGWLTFESAAGDKRRSAPAPAEWRSLPDDALLRLLAAARPARAGAR